MYHYTENNIASDDISEYERNSLQQKKIEIIL